MPSGSRAGPRHLPLAQAALLGALHGPAELWPVSSSAHVNLIPRLLGWGYAELDPELCKSFEVALHAGTAAALLTEPGRGTAPGGQGRVLRLALASAPPAAAGYAFKPAISRRLGTPGSIGIGLIVGGIAMIAADRAPERRTMADAGAIDALWLGLAQACALLPGVSRSGATLVAARLRGFTRPAAAALSEEVALPVIVGAATLETVDSVRRGVDRGAAQALAVGAGASLASGLLSLRLIAPLTGRISLRGFAVYRIALGSLALATALRPTSTARRRPRA